MKQTFIEALPVQHDWKGLQTVELLKDVYWYSNDLPYHDPKRCDLNECEGSEAWNRLIGRAFKHYHLNSSPPIPVRNELHHITMCDGSKGYLEAKAIKFEKETSEWIEFPVYQGGQSPPALMTNAKLTASHSAASGVIA